MLGAGKKMSLYWLILLSTLCCGVLEAYKYYQDRLPNGGLVPHPCKPNYLWSGVGHRNLEGGGPRNVFGEDFAANGHVWNQCLCQRDSDGDGKTNGEELGDPDCVWKDGEIPRRTTGLSHPGVCEPLDDIRCIEKNGADWDLCYTAEFVCDPLKEPGVKNHTFRFPKRPVPNKETTYMCMHFDFPEEGDFHVIADEPEIDNEYVMHHILLYGCDDVRDATGQLDTSWIVTTPTECGMSGGNCRSIVGGWTLGKSGACHRRQFGYRVGTNGFKTFLLQFHWNNPELRDDYEDGSGLTVHYTPNRRDNDGGTLVTGPAYLTIPPGRDSVVQEGGCSSNCTAHHPESIYFTSVLLHMHYLGKAGALEQYRDGNLIRTVAADVDYNYDRPTQHFFEEPVEFKPGDQLKMTCDFRSTYKTKTVYFGDATSDEMCLAFISYYPIQPRFSQCLTYKSLDICQLPGTGNFAFQSCDVMPFFRGAKGFIYLRTLEGTCAGENGEPSCKAGCAGAVENIRNNDNCLQGDFGAFMENFLIQKFMPDDKAVRLVQLLHACDPDWNINMLNNEQPGIEKPDETDEDMKSDDTDDKEEPDVVSDDYCVFNGSESVTGLAFGLMLMSMVVMHVSIV